MFSERALLPKRVTPPALTIEELKEIAPKLNVLISHNHYDHLDLPTLFRLFEIHSPRIAAGLGTRRFLNDHGIRWARDFDWWQSEKLTRHVRVTSVPAEHFSMRGLCDRDTMLWSGWVIESDFGNVYFAGDTGDGPHFAEIGRRLGPIRLSLLPVGAFRPEWFMAPVHIGPKEAIGAHRALRSSFSIPIHEGTFRQGDDGFTEPVDTLRALAEAENPLRDELVILGAGVAFDVPPLVLRSEGEQR